MADVAKGSVLLTPRFDNLTETITDQLSGAFKSVSSTASEGGEEAGGKFSKSFAASAAIAGVVSAAAAKAFDLLGSSIGSAISRTDTMNNFPKVMKNLGYTTEDASASIQTMAERLDGLPTSLDAMTSMVQTLAPMSSSLSEATDLGLALNDMFLASGASTADVSRAMQQYTQILAKGKPDWNDWKTLTEVMSGQLGQVAQEMLGTGASTTDLYNALKNGTVSMDDFNAAVLKLDSEGTGSFASFSEQAQDATKGIGTAISNVPNKIAAGVQAIINAIGAEDIATTITNVALSFKNLGNTVASVIEGIKAFGAAPAEALNAISPAIGVVATAFRLLLSALPEGFLDGLSAALQAIAPAAGVAATAFLVLLPALRGISAAIGVLQGLSGLAGIITALGGPVVVAVAAITALALALVYLYNNNETVRNALNTAWTAIQLLFTTVCTAIQTVISTVWPVIQSVISTAMAVIQSVISTILAAINGDWGTVWNNLKAAFSAIWSGIKSAASNGIQAVFTTVTGIKDKITGFFSGAGQWLVNSGKALLDGFKQGITDGFNSAKSAVESGLDTLRSFFPFSPAKQGPFSGHGYTTYSGKALMQGLASGITSGASSAASAAASSLSAVQSALSGDSLAFSAVADADARSATALANGSALLAAGSGVSTGDTYNLVVDGATVNDHEAIKKDFVTLMYDLHRLGAMNVG